MSEYLNIYLVPKKSKDGDKQASPMYITSYSLFVVLYLALILFGILLVYGLL